MIHKIKHIFYFLLLFKLLDLLFACTLDYFHENTLYGENGGNLNSYLKQKNCDTLFLGASRFQNGVDPQAFGKQAFNLSNQQMHILFQTASLDILEQKNRLPSKLLVLHLEVEDFSSTQDSSNQTDIHFLKYHYNSNQFVRQEIQHSSPTEFIKYYAASYRHNKNIISLISNYFLRRNKSIGVKGYYGLPDKIKNFDTLNINLLPNHSEVLSSSQLTKKCLQHIKKICANHKIKLLIVTAPIYRVDDSYHKLARKLKLYLDKQNIPYLNYNDPNLNPNFHYSFWFDLKHLNKKGSVSFTKLLKQDLNQFKIYTP